MTVKTNNGYKMNMEPLHKAYEKARVIEEGRQFMYSNLLHPKLTKRIAKLEVENEYLKARLKAARAFRSRGVKHGEPANVIWQIKNKLNYGRY